MRMRTVDSPRLVRVALVLLMLGGAYLAVSPWLDCSTPLGTFIADAARICALGDLRMAFVSGWEGPHWPRLLVGVLYAAAAVWVGVAKRIRL